MLSLSEIILQQGSVEAKATSNEVTGDEEDKKPKKKKKAEKDPNAPKRNLSSYMLYSQAVRPDTVSKHPDLKAVDIAKLIGEKWNALTDKEKQPYVKQAEKEKVRFDKETATYKQSLTEEDSSDDNTATTVTASKRKTTSNESDNKKKVKKEPESSKKDSEPKKKSKKKN